MAGGTSFAFRTAGGYRRARRRIWALQRGMDFWPSGGNSFGEQGGMRVKHTGGTNERFVSFRFVSLLGKVLTSVGSFEFLGAGVGGGMEVHTGYHRAFVLVVSRSRID